MSSVLAGKTILVNAREASNILEWPQRRLYAAARKDTFPPGVLIILGTKRIRFDEEKLRRWKAQHEQIISAREAARLLDADVAVVRAEVRRGVYAPPVAERTESGRIFFNRNELLEWISSGGSYQEPTQQEIDRDFEVMKARAARERSKPVHGATGNGNGRKRNTPRLVG